MWKRIVFSFIILCFIITAAGCGGGLTVPSTPEPSDDFILIQVKDSESNIIFIAGEKNEDTLTILGGKDSQGDPIKITGTLYVSKQGDGVFLEAGIDGLPTYIIDSEGNKITFENYSNSTVDIALYDSNENLIEGPITIDVNPQDLLEIKQLYDSSHLKQKYMPWWGNFIDVQFDWALDALAFANNGVGMIYENGDIVGYTKPWEREINFFDLLTEDNFIIIYEATFLPTIVDDLSDLSDYVSSILDIIAEAMEEESNGEDFINIISVTPDSGLIDGVDTDFTVVVEYNLASSDEGELSIAFNDLLNGEGNPDNHWVLCDARYYINKGSGMHEFNVIRKPKDWGSEGDFNVWACIDEIPEIDNWLLDCDEKILTFY